MSLLLPTSKKALLLAATPVDIHGQAYVDLVFSLEEDPEVLRRARVGSTDAEGALDAGCTVLIHFVMGVATSVERVTG
jgi:hypothetical protein